MNIGMVCYASVGGSGVVATELAHALAVRGHHVHLDQQRAAVPVARRASPGCRSSASRCRRIRCFASRSICWRSPTPSPASPSEHQLDIVHAHYAVPHATAAYLADQMLASELAATAPRTVTTLHGTDITLVGSDPSYAASWPSRSSSRTP